MAKCPNCSAPMQGNSCSYCHYTAPIEKNNVSENIVINNWIYVKFLDTFFTIFYQASIGSCYKY